LHGLLTSAAQKVLRAQREKLEYVKEDLLDYALDQWSNTVDTGTALYHYEC